ncbi:MAG: DNRLRE domain-containing protein, partial [Bacteroidota bacterium]
RILTASDREANDGFGNAVAIDGNRLVIGAESEDDDENGNNNLNSAGSAYVFEINSSGNWAQVKKLVSSDRAATDVFGSAVDVSGNFIIVGAPLEDQNANGQSTRTSAGSAYLYERNGSGNWSQIQKIVNSDRSQRDNFGYGVGISGTYALIGARQEDDDDDNGLSDAGAAYIFEQNMRPIAVCQNLTVAVNGNCEDVSVAPEDFDNGSSDPNGDDLTFTLNMSGPFSLGTTNLVLTVSDGELSDNCNVSLTVVDDSPPTVTSLSTIVFQNGAEIAGNPYFGSESTALWAEIPDSNLSANLFFSADDSPVEQSIIQFKDIIGASVGQIPPGVTIVSAELSLRIFGQGSPSDDLELARILGAWNAATATWNNFTLNGNTQAGVQQDGIEASNNPGTFSSGLGIQTVDVTDDVQAWVDGVANHGWAIFNPSTNGVDFSSTASNLQELRPSLKISYLPAPENIACSSFTRSTDVGSCSYTVMGEEFDVFAFDNCDVIVTGYDFTGTGTLAGATFPVGTTPVTFSAIDQMGTEQTCNFTVTIEDNEPPFVGADFTDVVVFKNGIDDYFGTEDATIDSTGADTPMGSQNEIEVDLNPLRQGLLQFTDIIGDGAEQIPVGSIITSAVLDISVFNRGGAGLEMASVLGEWDESMATWNNFMLNGNTEAGAQRDGVEASTTLRIVNPDEGLKRIDVTEDVQNWVDFGNNNGWVFFNPSGNGLGFRSSEFSDTARLPTLSVNYLRPEDSNPCVSFTRFPNEAGCSYMVSGDEFDPPATDNCGVFSIENSFNNSMSLEGEILPQGVTTVTFTVEDEAGNTDACTFDIEILPPPSPSFTITDPIFCEDEGSSTPTVIVSPVDGVFSGPGVTDNENGCTASDQVQVDLDDQSPTAVATTADSLSCLITQVTLSIEGSSEGNSILYNWQDFDGATLGSGSTLSVTQAVTYNLIVTDTLNGCLASAEVVVVEDNTPPDFQFASIS